MSNKIIAFLAVVLALTSLYSFAANSDTQKMNTNQALTAAQQSIVPIAAFTANGEMDKLKTALHQGLDAGLTVNEIKEILVQLYAYAGFPRSLNGLAAFMDVIREREAKGIKDEIGKTADPLPADMSVLALGTEIQTQLSGKPVTGPLFDFAPAIDQFLKTHLFVWRYFRTQQFGFPTPRNRYHRCAGQHERRQFATAGAFPHRRECRIKRRAVARPDLRTQGQRR